MKRLTIYKDDCVVIEFESIDFSTWTGFDTFGYRSEDYKITGTFMLNKITGWSVVEVEEE